MSEETKNPEQQPTNSTPEGNGGQGNEKLFTQEEVNRIVSERLARERDKATTEKAKADPMEQREKDLAAREAALSCREYISEKGYPVSLLEVFDTGDSNRFRGQVDKLLELFPTINPAVAAKMPIATRGCTPASPGRPSGAVDRIAEAFRLK